MVKKMINKKIGEKLKTKRIMLGLSQKDLALKLNVTFQQVQKYEKGKNKISAGTLYKLSNIFNIPMISFFGEEDKSEENNLTNRMVLEIVKNCNKLQPNILEKISDLIREVSR